ncbi:sulfotransferase [Lacimicrobium sp. SS2-24]|uniref:sulfotransferase n=1 Tax=Lacimicrobium sp. SS2-24 TaxID=2005569 RepID=UPI000B4B10CB|nr:sulfotransferase [Lacimicrobium sp. SS2-24]
MNYLCTGWNRTGTTSVGSLLKKLGSKHESFTEELFGLLIDGNIGRLLEIASNIDSADDFPFNLLYREIKSTNQDLKVVHTYVSDPETWIKRQKTLALRAPTKRLKVCNFFLYGKSSPFLNEQAFIERYMAHNDEVRSFFKEDPNFIAVDLTESKDREDLFKWIEGELNQNIERGSHHKQNVTKKAFLSYSEAQLQQIKFNITVS